MQSALKLRFAMEEAWYKELIRFVMVPLIIMFICCFIPVFKNKHGLSHLVIIPLSGLFSYSHALSPRKAYFEKSWKEVMDFPAFVLASGKKAFLFAIPAGLVGWVASLFLEGLSIDLALLFETCVWGLGAGIFLYALSAYVKLTFKLKKIDRKCLAYLWKWIVPTAGVLTLLLVSKSIYLIQMIEKRI